jgi:broad specificity phosphatase PhoE
MSGNTTNRTIYAGRRIRPGIPPTDGETAIQIAARALPVITEIESTHKDGNVLVVSHKATIRIILCSLLGIDVGRYRDRINALAAAVSIVKFGAYGPMLEVLGDRSYMAEHLRKRSGT